MEESEDELSSRTCASERDEYADTAVDMSYIMGYDDVVHTDMHVPAKTVTTNQEQTLNNMQVYVLDLYQSMKW